MLVPDPQNPWSGQTAKLLDFGMVRLGDLRRTAAGQLLGTPLYMAPEQIAGEENSTGPWTDVYALGVLLVELLTLHPTGPEESSMRGLLTRSGPRGLRQHLQHVRPDVPDSLCQIVLKALAPQPAERYGDAHQLLSALVKAFPWLDSGLRYSSENPVVVVRPRWRTVVATAAVLGAVTLVGHVLSPRLRVEPTLVTTRTPTLPPERPAPLEPPATPQPALPKLASDPLLQLASPLIELGGAEFRMGSTEMEAIAAYHWCQRMLGPSRESECILPVFQRESPQRRVYVSRYAIEQTEVSNRQLAAWLNTQQTLSVQMDPKGSKTEARWVRNKKERLVDLWPTRGMVRGLSRRDSLFQAEPGTEDLPAVQVSWTAASAYCASIGRRLPTEAEWEYAARTDKNLTFPWGAADPTCEGVVIARNPEDRCYRVGEQLSPVHLATQDRTAEGVLNLGGNVAEWVQDAYVPSYQPCTEPCRDPVVKEAGRRAAGKNLRIFRGGSWSLPIETARGATRSRAAAHTLAQTIGFRCAVSR